MSGKTSPLALTLNTFQNVQLASGGDAILSVPSGASVDGRLFVVTLAGYVETTTGTLPNGTNIALNFGVSPASVVPLASVNFTGITIPKSFVLQFYGYWDSVSSILLGALTPPGIFDGTSSTSIKTSVSAGDIKFSCSADSSASATDPLDTLTLTQFKMELA